VGICGSDMHIYNGVNPVLKPPIVLGHEFGGIIEEISSNSKNNQIKIGQKVAVFPLINCGKCYYCINNMDNLCINQKIFGNDEISGGMQEKVAVPLKNLVKLPDSFDIIYSSLVEPVAVATHVADDIKDSNIIIIGVGTIGLLIQQVCKKNNNSVITLDINSLSLRKSDNLQSDLTINFKDPNKVKKILKFLGKNKIDTVIDCVGNKHTLEFSINIIRKKGNIILVGVPENEINLDVVKILCNEINLRGSYLYSFDDFYKAKEYIINNNIDISEIDLKIFNLFKTIDAFKYKNNHPDKKVILKN
ncbi:unnamed protein product, partial [marine sediment metagenome]